MEAPEEYKYTVKFIKIVYRILQLLFVVFYFYFLPFSTIAIS